MPASYTLRMQFAPHQDSKLIAAEINSVCDQANVDEVMLFMYAEELHNGHETLEQIAVWLDTLRPWKQMLEARGVRVSLNPWTVLGMCDRGRRIRPEWPWQLMVDWRGQSCRLVTCPLDPDWHAYFKQSLAMMAAEKYRVIWIEDDFRYHNHDPLDWGGCFCDLHVAEFNRRAGTAATRDEIMQAMFQAGRPHPWRKIWLDMWQESALDLIDQWRRIVQPHGTQLGMMSSGMDVHAIEGRRWHEYWPALAGEGNPPIHRPHFWSYGDTSGKAALAESVAVLDQNRRLQPPGVESGPEIENFPYYSWNKSYTQTAAQMFLSQVSGNTNLNVSLYDFMGNLPSDDPSRAQFLGRLKPALSKIGDLFTPDMQTAGVGVVWREDASREIQIDQPQGFGDAGTGPNRLNCPSRPWANLLAAAGVGFAMADQPRVNALAGQMAWALTDDELLRLLAGGLLLDGPAAAVLAERGFAEHIGVSDLKAMSQNEVCFSIEEFTDPQFALRVGSQASLNLVGALAQGTPAPNARIISRVLSPRQQQLGHGQVLFENALGGRVATVPWQAQRQWMLCPQQVQPLRRVINWLSVDQETGRVVGLPWLFPQFMTDGQSFRAAIWNGGFDPVESFELHVPANWPALDKGLLFDASGTVTEFLPQAGKIILPRPMRQWELAVLWK